MPDNDATALSGLGSVLVGTNNGCVLIDDSWWNINGYKYRQQLMISNNTLTQLQNGYTVKITVDHASLVKSGKSMPSGNDIRIVFYDGKDFT